jgi:hypothetical protein
MAAPVSQVMSREPKVSERPVRLPRLRYRYAMNISLLPTLRTRNGYRLALFQEIEERLEVC